MIAHISPVRLGILATVSVIRGALPAANVAALAALVQSLTSLEDPADLSPVTSAAIAFGAILLATFVCDQAVTGVDLALRAVAGERIRTMYVTRSSSLDIDQFESPDTLDVMHRAGAEGADRVVGLIAHLIAMVAHVITIVSVSVVLVRWDAAAAALLLIAPFPVLVFSLRVAEGHFRVDRARTARLRSVSYFENLLLSARTIREVRQLGLTAGLLRNHREAIVRTRDEDLRHVGRLTYGVGALGLLGLGCYGVAIARVVANAVSSGAIGQLTGCLQAMGALQQAAGALVGGFASVHESLLYVANFFAYLKLPSDRVTGGNAPCPGTGPMRVELKGVGYRYPSSTSAVLDGVDLRIEPGRLVGVVGPNGSGKTTLLRLIARLCGPDLGEIVVDGVPVPRLSIDSYRRRVAFVFQEPARFQASLRENVMAGLRAEEAPDRVIEDALRRIGADPVQLCLADGLDSTLGREFGRGVELSSGQWQRVGIARAIVRDAGLVLMDEPTSAQDNLSAREVLHLLQEMRGATRVVVTHSPVIAAGCDELVVLDNGRVVECGRWADLLRRDGLLARLFAEPRPSGGAPG